jgi:hypothetical protein
MLGLIFIPNSASAQSGPGGVGNSDGSDGQPRNVLWLKSDVGISESGGDISSWADQSGNGLDATGTLDPLYNSADANFNNLPSVSFPNDMSYLSVSDNILLDDGSNFSFALVLRMDDANTEGILNKRTGFASNQAYRFFKNGGNLESLETEYQYILS